MPRPLKKSPWNLLAALAPTLGFCGLILWGNRLVPGVIAYSNDASWWAKHSSDVGLVSLAVAVPSILLIAARLDFRWRERRAREALEADARWAAASAAPAGAPSAS